MSGKGKGGKVGSKRHLKHRNPLGGISKPSLRRLARRGGVKRINGEVYEEARGSLKAFLERIVGSAVTYMDHSRRTTVSVTDVLAALKHERREMYT